MNQLIEQNNPNISIQRNPQLQCQQPFSAQKKIQKRGRPRNSQVESDNQILIELNKYWFGNDLSTDLLIYFCQQGSLVLHTKTGPKQGMKLQTSQQKKLLKTYRQQFRLNLIEKISQLMTLYKLDSQNRNILVCFSHFKIKDTMKEQYDQITRLIQDKSLYQNLLITLNQLSTQFQDTFLYILKCVFDDIYQQNIIQIEYAFESIYQDQSQHLQQNDNKIEELTEKILDWITENKDANQLILQLSSIQSLINHDANIFYELETQQLLLKHFKNNTQIQPFYLEQIEESQQSYIIYFGLQRLSYLKESWLYRFISGLLLILQKYIKQ